MDAKKVTTTIHRSVLTCLMLAAAGAAAAQAAQDEADSLADLSIEQLLNESITTVSKREQRLGDVAAAVSVLTNDDLRRSGVTTVADALRLVPGMQVGAINSGVWAISARGFNMQFANKLLVMIDGRTIYSPLFSGVYWETQQVMMADVDRIEVIRGPGATLWGANAVNGVINVVTKSSRNTQGGFAYAGGGSAPMALGGVRYGDKIGTDTYYRAYANYHLNGDFELANGRSAEDRWDIKQGGFRVDHYTQDDGQVTWQGDAYTGKLTMSEGDVYGVNTIGRWSRRLSQRSSVEVQAFGDRAYRNDFAGKYHIDTGDLSFQHTFGLGGRHDLIWGTGYRYTRIVGKATKSPLIEVLDPDLSLNLFSAFVQDEIRVLPEKLTFTIGTKLEHNDFTGVEVQPSARVVLKPAENHTLWSAASRAVRTPSAVEGKDFVNFGYGEPFVGPGGLTYISAISANRNAESEVMYAYELGYRGQLSPSVNLDVATFYNDYRELLAWHPTALFPRRPIGMLKIQSFNSMQGESYGGETTLTVAPAQSWRLAASYSYLKLHIRGELQYRAEELEDNAPEHQFLVRSSHDFASRASLDLQLRYVDAITGVPSYFTADLHLSYRPTENLEIMLAGHNLLDARHAEQLSPLGLPAGEVPRGVYARLSQRF